ncbi:MAG: hypothetical protein HYV28_12185 [Ignavibacteriales bacterium]|nr:hypothetical protein [Ignavibacteriales bacterium]
MKNTLILFLLLSAIYPIAANGQSLKPIPDPHGTRFFYKHPSKERLSSVAVAGAFNNWDKSTNYMSYDKESGIWTGVVSAKTGIEYHYKLVINDSLWITDPNAPDFTEDEWRNGIIIPQEYGKPYIAASTPAFNKRVISIDTISIALASPFGSIAPNSIAVFVNEKPARFTFNSQIEAVKIPAAAFVKSGENKIQISFADNKGNKNQGTVIRFFYDIGISKIKTPEYFDSSIMYEVNVRKFADSDSDGIGDLKGLTGKLPYLVNDLGINVLWLMPINESNTEHGYNVLDYFSIEIDYGSFADYQEFISTCKKYNVKVFFDFVLNHTDSSHAFFLDAYKNPSSKYSSWYQFTNKDNSDWNHFGVERKMPKLDFDNPQVREYFIKVSLYWIDPNSDGKFDDGIDGFRCDAAKEVPHDFWNIWRAKIKSINPAIVLLGEVWDNANYCIPFYLNEFDALFCYPLLYAMDEYINRNDIGSLQRRLNEFPEIYPSGFQTVTFLANHDNNRALSRYGSFEKLRIALFLLFTLPGTPMVYYGDELGLEGKMPPENVRQQFDWTKLESGMMSENRFIALYKEMINLRKSNGTLSARNDKTQQSLIFAENDNKKVLSYLRTDTQGKYLVLINNSELPCDSLIVEVKTSAVNADNMQIKYSSNTVKMKDFALTLDIQGNFLNFKHLNLQPSGCLLIKLK